jgi:LPXTG-motif cell wall-anchored protein
MKKRTSVTPSLRAAAVGAVIALVVAPFLAATSAVAATGQNVLVFVNGSVSDTSPGQEVDQTITALEADDSTVTTFDGGDGSESAWVAALTGIDVIVFPDAESGGAYYAPGGTAWMSDDALAALVDWVEAGGDVVVMGTYGSTVAGDFFEALSGLPFSSVWAVTDGLTPLQRVGGDTSLPASLDYADGTYPIVDVASWPTALTATLTPLYVTSDGDGLGVGRWTLGTGSFSYNAWDYYPWFGATVDPSEADNVNAWYAVLSQLLALAVDAPQPQPQPVVDDAPQLAATGAESVAVLLVISAALLASGSALVWVRRRAHAA